jgi:glycerophosphoryl diester phosphodiesterase
MAERTRRYESGPPTRAAHASSSGVLRASAALVAAALPLVWATACGDATGQGRPAFEVVRERIAALAPSANLGHRGTGVNRPGHALPENSIPSFLAAMPEGADGIELDVELTSDGALLVMHDDTLDRTTTCSGCVSAYTLADAQQCFLLDGDGAVTDLHPPTLAEVYTALPEAALVNVELKVYGAGCATPTTGATALAAATVTEVEHLGVGDRTLFSSFDTEAAGGVKAFAPALYAALLVSVDGTLDWESTIATASSLGLEAIHPLFVIVGEGVATARAEGFQVNVWTVDNPTDMEDSLEKGVTAIITDEPAVLAGVIAGYGG